MKKIAIHSIALVLTLSMIIAGVCVYADEPEVTATETEETSVTTSVLPDPAFELVAETDKVALYADKKIGEIKFVDKVNGTEWYSNPQDKSSTIDLGEYKERLYSQFTIEYSRAYNLLTTSSSTDCLKYTRKESDACLSTKMLNKLAGFDENAGRQDLELCESLKHEAVDNGIKFIYTMPKFGFKIVLQYTVKDDYMEVSLITDESILSAMKMEKQSVSGFQTRVTQVDYNITRLDILPMFGAGRMGEEGYMFLPDESGVIANFNNGKENYKEYDMPVYGKYYETKEYAKRSEGVRMPVFGVSKPTGTLMGVVTESAAVAFMRAYVSGKNTEFNNVYSSAQICIVEENVGETAGIPYARSMLGDNNYTVRYYSIGSENGGYVGMAKKYREYLVKEKGMTKNQEKDSAIFLDVYGQVNKDKNILGVPVEMPETLTSYDDMTDMVETLLNEGVENPTVRYTNWQSHKIEGTVNEKVKTSSYLGGKDDFKDMVEYMNEKNISFYPNVEYVNFSKGTSKYSKFNNAIKKADQSPTTISRSRIPVKLGNKWYILKAESLKKGLGNFVNDYLGYNVGGLAIDSIASMVYSDYQSNSSLRTDTEQVWEEVLKNAKEKTGKVMVDEASAYVFPYADVILTTPSTDAYCEFADQTVPFYQMVLHGYVNFGTEAINLSAAPEMIRLKAIETGAALTYSVFAAESSAVKDTYMDYLFSSSFDLVKDTMLSYYEADKGYYEKVNGQTISNHEILAENVTKTTYENGVSVIVNYNSNDITVADGVTVKAKSYIMH